MEIIALLLGLYLGSKCHAPLNILLKILHDKFGRFEGMAWYTLLCVLLYKALETPGLVIALALPVIYTVWEFSRKFNWMKLEESARQAAPSAYPVPLEPAIEQATIVVPPNGNNGNGSSVATGDSVFVRSSSGRSRRQPKAPNPVE